MNTAATEAISQEGIQEEILEEELSEATSTFLGGVRRVLMAGVGAVALAQEEIDEFVGKLVERGEIAEKDGRKTSRQPRSKSPNSRSSPTTIADFARPGRSSCGCRSNWWN